MKFNLTPMADALHKIFSVTVDGAHRLAGRRNAIAAVGVATFAAWALVEHPPLETVAAGDVAVRTNRLTIGRVPVGQNVVADEGAR